MTTRLTVTVEEAASMLGISRALAYALVRRDELPSVRLGRRLVVPLSAIQRLLAAAENITDVSDSLASETGAS